MRNIAHRSRNHAARGQNVMDEVDVMAELGVWEWAEPELQPMLLRLGLAVGDINASGVSRVEHVKSIAAVIVKARSLR